MELLPVRVNMCVSVCHIFSSLDDIATSVYTIIASGCNIVAVVTDVVAGRCLIFASV